MAEEERPRRERWASRLREIGNIVLGVLIALALGAVATAIGWRIEAASARSALADELGEIIGQGLERERADQCVERKLDAIAAILTEAEHSGRLPATGSIGNPIYRTWSVGVWGSTVGADIGSHLDRENFSTTCRASISSSATSTSPPRRNSTPGRNCSPSSVPAGPPAQTSFTTSATPFRKPAWRIA